MTKPDQMVADVIAKICADPHVTDAFKRGLRKAEEIRKEMEAFYQRVVPKNCY